MDLANTFWFVVTMLTLAALPSSSVALVVTRAATHGVANGISVSAGIVVGDLVFIAVVLLGVSVLSATMGALFSVMKVVGGTYLIWLGYSLFRSKPSLVHLEAAPSRSSLLNSFLAGLALTLGDMKAILFYASLFPNLFELAEMSVADVTLIVVVTILIVGGVKVTYAIAARRIVKRFSNGQVNRHGRKVAGSILVAAGGYLIIKG